MSLRLIQRKFSWYFPLFFVIIIAVGIASSMYVYRLIDSSLRESLIYRAETIALALDPSDILALQGDESDIEKAEYQNLKTKLTQIRQANKDSRFVYVMNKRNGEIYFVADSENSESEDYSPPGQVYYEESLAFENAFALGMTGSEGPVGDRWGTWITGVAPIIKKDNKVIAVVGIDVDALEFHQQLLTYSSIPLVLSLVLVIFAYLGMRLRRQEQEFLEIKSRFVAVASHDIRSPLTGVSWATQSLAKSSSLSFQDRKLASEIRDKIQFLVVIANDILDAMSLDMPQVHLIKLPLVLKDVIEQSVQNISFYAEEKKVFVNVQEIPNHALVMGDMSKLQQLFINVLSNAIKYSRKSAGDYRTEVLVKYTVDGLHHIITIIDHGIGIPKDEQKHIFKGFYRTRNAEAYSVEGTGLGLYLVKCIVELHGGSVSLTSEEDKGTSVVIRLPRLDKAL